jgi:uncharacterized protein (DUF736 family)
VSYDNRGTGVLFKNDHKKNDKHPDYKGDFTAFDGTKYDLAAWIKEGKNGRKFMSLKISEPWAPSQEPASEPADESQDEPF